MVFVYLEDGVGYYQVQGKHIGPYLDQDPKEFMKQLEEEGGHTLTEDQVKTLEKDNTVLVIHYVDVRKEGGNEEN